MTTLWFSSDWHLGHDNIRALSGRPFDTVEEMNEAIIDRHNALVRPRDHAWILGDAALGPITESLALVKRFNGHLHLILGNHDRPFMAHHVGRESLAQEWTERYLAAGFETVLHGPTLQTVGGRDVLLSHFPYRGDSQDVDRWTELRPVDHGHWLLHGHTHAPKRVQPAERMVHVGVDAWDFRPVSEDEVAQVIRQAERGEV